MERRRKTHQGMYGFTGVMVNKLIDIEGGYIKVYYACSSSQFPGRQVECPVGTRGVNAPRELWNRCG